MVGKLRSSLITSHLTVALFAVFVVHAVIFVFINSGFFVGENAINDTVAESVNRVKEAVADDKISVAEENALKKYAAEHKIYIKITGTDVGLLFQSAKELPLSNYMILKGIETSRSFELGNGKTLTVSYYLPLLTPEERLQFNWLFNKLLILNTLASLFFAFLIAAATAKKPLKDLEFLRDSLSLIIKGARINKNEYKVRYVEIEPIIDGLNSLQANLWKKEELKKRMTADFAHELRTPLTTLQTHLEALIDGVWQPDRQRFESCHEEVLRMIRLVGNLEQLSKAEDHNLKLEKTEFDVTKLIRNIYTSCQGEFQNKHIHFYLRGIQQLIVADKDKISQVLVNLFTNSIKYTPKYGKILVDIQGNPNYVTITVNDNGIGIPVKDLPNIFDRLYRTDLSRARASGGSGLGLAIAKTLVEAHMGSIDVVSQVGLGTEVTVILPRK